MGEPGLEASWRDDQRTDPPAARRHPRARPSGTFRAADASLNLAANQQGQFERLCRVIGRPELATDPRFVEREARKRHRAALTAELELALAAKPAAAWVRLLTAAGVPAGEILTVPEALAHEQIRARQLLRDIPDTPAFASTTRPSGATARPRARPGHPHRARGAGLRRRGNRAPRDRGRRVARFREMAHACHATRS